MRALIAVVIIFIAMFISSVIYLEIDKRRFGASLPKPPKDESVNNETLNSTTEDINPLVSEDDMSTELDLSPPETMDIIDEDSKQPTEDMLSDIFEQNTDSVDNIEGQLAENVDNIEGQLAENGDDSSTEKQIDQHDYLYHRPRGIPDPIYSMSPAEQETELERRRQKLIEDFGDTPEVSIIIKHFHSRVIPSGSSTTLKGAEGLEVLRALSVLWPTESNVRIYQNLKQIQDNAWHVE